MQASEDDPSRVPRVESQSKLRLRSWEKALGVQPQRFARRLRIFSYARALVFTATGVFVAAVLTRTTTGQWWGYSLRVLSCIVAAAWFSAALQWWVSRRQVGQHGLAMSLLLLDQALFTGVVYLTGGVASGATSLLGVSCLVGGLLLGLPGAVAAVVAGIIFFSLILLIVQAAPELLPPDQAHSLYSVSQGQTAFYYVFSVLMLLLVGLLAGYLAERLQRTGGELIEAEQRAEKAERLAVLGRLSAGLAHEIRNPLGSISGAMQLLKEGMTQAEDQELCRIVLDEAARLEELVADMTDLARTRRAERECFDVGALVRDVVLLAQRSGRGAVDVSVVAQGLESVEIDGDPSQLRQLVWNLVRNAIQASGAGGEVRIRLELGAEETVLLSVEDDGVGMDSETRKHLFDDFFTTRNQGTGLGLAVVKRIADEHGFVIKVEGKPGEGAQFVVDFGHPRSAVAG